MVASMLSTCTEPVSFGAEALGSAVRSVFVTIASVVQRFPGQMILAWTSNAAHTVVHANLYAHHFLNRFLVRGTGKSSHISRNHHTHTTWFTFYDGVRHQSRNAAPVSLDHVYFESCRESSQSCSQSSACLSSLAFIPKRIQSPQHPCQNTTDFIPRESAHPSPNRDQVHPREIR